MISTKQLLPAILLSLATTLLSACGGGGTAGETGNAFTSTNNTNTKPQTSSVESSANTLSSNSSSSAMSIASSSASIILNPSSSSASSKSTSSASSTSSKSSVRSTSGGPDITPPATPNNFEVVSVFSDVVFLSWGKTTDNVAVVAYKVFRDGIQIAEIEELENYYADYTVAAGKTYLYGVSAGDAVGNWSSIVTVKIVTPTASHISSSSANSSSNSASSISSSKASSSINSSSASSKASSSASSAAVVIGVSFEWLRPLFRENGTDIFEHEIARYELRYKLPNETNFTTAVVTSPMVSKTLIDVPSNAYFEIATVDVNGAYSRFVPIHPL
jgi:hypothetical protein